MSYNSILTLDDLSLSGISLSTFSITSNFSFSFDAETVVSALEFAEEEVLADEVEEHESRAEVVDEEEAFVS